MNSAKCFATEVKKKMSDKLWKADEASKQLGMTETYLRRLARAGEIQTVRIGKRGIRFPESEIDAFIEKRKQK